MKIINPFAVTPTINPNEPRSSDGRLVHRRVVSPMTGGPKSIDVGYNAYKAGVSGAIPYAYTKDEFCYTTSGEMHNVSSGVAAISQPGMFMWRPAGTATHSAEVKKDTVTICAFGPARLDNFSHRLSPETIGQWDGDEATRRSPRRRHYSEIEPAKPAKAPIRGKIVYRPVFTTVRDGSEFMEISHTVAVTDVTWRSLPNERDVVWFLEKGEMRIEHGDQKYTLKTNEFLYRSPGEVLEVLEVAAKSVVIAFSARPI